MTDEKKQKQPQTLVYPGLQSQTELCSINLELVDRQLGCAARSPEELVQVLQWLLNISPVCREIFGIEAKK